MDELPALALKKKKDSSMRVAIDLVKSGEVQACVSAGNTGALMATSKFVLKTIRGISRPAICFWVYPDEKKNYFTSAAGTVTGRPGRHRKAPGQGMPAQNHRHRQCSS